jgi:hypothetical protein
VRESRYLVPAGADWAVWDDVNAVLTFMTDGEAVENAWENEALLGREVGRGLPPDPTPEQAWAYVNALWERDPGGRGWQVRVPFGATWLWLRDDEDDPARGGGPEPAFVSASRRWARASGRRRATDKAPGPRQRRRVTSPPVRGRSRGGRALAKAARPRRPLHCE